MNKLEPIFSKACGEIMQNLLTVNDPTKKQVKNEIKKICAKYALARIPRNHEILSMAKDSDFSKLQKVLLKKPIKTASGVSIIALMPKPYACPHGRCTYCPGGIEYNSPNSYTGKEPSTLNAIENEYDPKLQITTKIKKLIAYGHDPSKMEIVIVGGTFLFMPKDYQENFIKSCYDALNGTDSDNLEDAKSNNEHAKIRMLAHMMPGLPTMTPEGDIADFKKLFDDSQLRPDMLKIYPSLVIENTPLYDEYKRGEYTPYSDQDMIKVLTEVKRNIPKWVRIMRVQREISPNEIIAGPKSGNLRQIVHQNLSKQGISCKCIRCREAGL